MDRDPQGEQAGQALAAAASVYFNTGTPSGDSAYVSPDPLYLGSGSSGNATLHISSGLLQILGYSVSVTACGSGICHTTYVNVSA